MSVASFYDLPVYRLTRERYSTELDKDIDEKINRAGSAPAEHDVEIASRRANWYNEHVRRQWGCWEFNEIIGYIRLHFVGTQVRGEYFAVSKRRLIRTRKKLYEFQTWKLAPEVDIKQPYSTGNILAAIQRYIENCRREVPKHAFVDDTVFNVLAPHVDWQVVFGSAGIRPPT